MLKAVLKSQTAASASQTSNEDDDRSKRMPESPLQRRKAGGCTSNPGMPAAAAATATSNSIKKIMASESESARTKLTGALNSMIWSLKSAVLTSLLTASPTGDTANQRTRNGKDYTSVTYNKKGYDKLPLNGATVDEETQVSLDGGPCDGLDDDPGDVSSDDDSWVDDYSCLVCERVFLTARQLERHQLKKRHWGCSACDRRFPSSILLEYHKDEFDHWSEDDLPYDSNDEDDFDSLREVMNDEVDHEAEYGPEDEDREMLL